MTQYNKSILKQFALGVLVTANSISLAYAVDAPQPNRTPHKANIGSPNNMGGMGNKSSRNPFVKPPTSIPNMPPSGLPPEFMATREMGGSYEPKDSKYEWTNMRIVGILGKNVLLRVEDLNNVNNQNMNNQNGSIQNGNNTTPAITILATLDTPFLFNKTFYTLGHEKNVYTVYNQHKKALHSMILESSPMQLIQKNSTGGGGNGNGNAARTNQGASGGTRR